MRYDTALWPRSRVAGSGRLQSRPRNPADGILSGAGNLGKPAPSGIATGIPCMPSEAVSAEPPGVDVEPRFRSHAHIELTYVLVCYLNQSDTTSLVALLRSYAGYAPDVLDRIQFILVDDGSPLRFEIPEDIDINLLLLRITVDIPWNEAGARNLALTYARSDKVLMSDLDYILPESSLRRLLRHRNPGHTVFNLWALVPDERTWMKSSFFFLSRARYLRFYGYDEELSGHYGFKDWMFWRWQRSNGTRFRRLARRCHGVVRQLDRERSYHSLARDVSHNRAVAMRNREGMRRYGPARGHSRAFLRFPWQTVLDRARSTPPPAPRRNRLWVKSWWWRFLVSPH